MFNNFINVTLVLCLMYYILCSRGTIRSISNFFAIFFNFFASNVYFFIFYIFLRRVPVFLSFPFFRIFFLRLSRYHVLPGASIYSLKFRGDRGFSSLFCWISTGGCFMILSRNTGKIGYVFSYAFPLDSPKMMPVAIR